MNKSEKRVFSVHPGIIKHLIKEQAGTLVKAIAELVMNSVDAGATRIDLDFNADGTFTIKDNGIGFQNRDEITAFFETFGTPHSEGDATFGRFRIGRGQIMAFANTTWRSGNFIMEVITPESGAEFGYTLTESSDYYAGCQINGQITNRSVIYEARRSGLTDEDRSPTYSDEQDIQTTLRFVKTPVYLAGRLISLDPSKEQWTREDEFGYYLFDKSHSLTIYNQGIYVKAAERNEFSVGGIFVSKQPIKLNMARNAWLNHECVIMRHFREVAHDEYRAVIDRSSRMTESEIGAIIHRITFEFEHLDDHEIGILYRSKFIPSLNGLRVSPCEFLDAHQYSIYDGTSSLIAERAIEEGGVSLFTYSYFRLGGIIFSEDNAKQMIENMAYLFRSFVNTKRSRKFVPFQTLINAYSGTFIEIPDSDLPPKQLAALKSIRYVCRELKSLTEDNSHKIRAMVAGKSDVASAWTNGFSYIAFDTSELENAYLTRMGGGIERLVNLAIHEFCHQAESSEDTHEHTREFYVKYHNATLKFSYYDIVRKCHRYYLKQLLKLGLKVSSEDYKHARALGGVSKHMDDYFPLKSRRPSNCSA
ncbi:TPA: ATP-binding protein [Pseudomonas aeruginosa]|nr:ATP-binding protein [Pseudomonas aeruginosa]